MKSKDQNLITVRRNLDELYGDRLDRVILFGSRARGDARAESDYDLAIFLTSMPDRWIEFDRLAALRVKYLEEGGPFFDMLPYLAASYKDTSLPIMHEIRQDGIEI